ncbi:hypothetical protein [Planomonospora parontospora]|uniref:hypothetical protein n=1 Tax=Planomonospora parontospora TaxID=58119 RepID=UPI0016704C0F|nr:hypothetical protein [Planomonospora parontospora]GGL35813.1 hypothetical protein GCM10014719_41280 [Planomonospora parontospora subsp. antibiotica]
MLRELAARPAGEPPFTALGHAMRAVVAELREGEPADVHLPHFVVTLFTTVARVGLEHCTARSADDLSALTERLEQILALAERSLRPGWDRPSRQAPSPA